MKVKEFKVATSYAPVNPWTNGKVIGNKRDAKAALDLYHKRADTQMLYNITGDRRDWDTIPTIGERGVSYISEGAMRATFVDRYNRVVYKIVKPNTPIANISEYERMKRVYAIPALRKHATPTSLFIVEGKPIIAMKFIANSASWADHKERKIRRAVEIYNRKMIRTDEIRDMHNENWRIDGRGTPRFTDLGDVLWFTERLTGFVTGQWTREAKVRWEEMVAKREEERRVEREMEQQRLNEAQAQFNQAQAVAAEFWAASAKVQQDEDTPSEDWDLREESVFCPNWTCGNSNSIGICQMDRDENAAHGFADHFGKRISAF